MVVAYPRMELPSTKKVTTVGRAGFGDWGFSLGTLSWSHLLDIAE